MPRRMWKDTKDEDLSSVMGLRITMETNVKFYDQVLELVKWGGKTHSKCGRYGPRTIYTYFRLCRGSQMDSFDILIGLPDVSDFADCNAAKK